MKDRLLVVGAVTAGVLAWAVAAEAVGPLLLPGPAAVVRAMLSEHRRLLLATGTTALAAGSGLVIATVLGLGAAMIADTSRVAARALLPYTTLVQVVPIIAIAPLLVVWCGYGPRVAGVTAAIAAFYPVYSAGRTGLRAPSRDLVDLFQLYGASRWKTLIGLRLPAALPALFSGLRTAAGLAVIGAIVGEFVGSNGIPPSLGQLVVASARSARMDLCFGAITAAGLLAALTHSAIVFAERRLVASWYGS